MIDPASMPNWYSALKEFGLPAMMLIALCWFFSKKIWPYLISKDKDRDDLINHTIRDLSEVIRGNNNISEKIQNHMERITKTQEITTRELISEIRAGRK